jgi:Domain of unknown function (DUF4136)
MKYVFCAVAALVLAGCATQVSTNVVRYHSLEKKLDGSYGTYRFYIPSEKAGSLEYAAHVDSFKKQLNANGFREETSGGYANYTAFFIFSIWSSGSTASIQMPIQTAQGGAFARGFNIGSAAGGGSVSSSETYSRLLTFNLVDAQHLIDGKPKTIYESSLRSVGSSDNPSQLIPVFAKAMFVGFPGKSGETKSVSLPLGE